MSHGDAVLAVLSLDSATTRWFDLHAMGPFISKVRLQSNVGLSIFALSCTYTFRQPPNSALLLYISLILFASPVVCFLKARYPVFFAASSPGAILSCVPFVCSKPWRSPVAGTLTCAQKHFALHPCRPPSATRGALEARASKTDVTQNSVLGHYVFQCFFFFFWQERRMHGVTWCSGVA